MNTVRFINNFSEVVKKLKSENFSGSDLHKLATECALKLEELEYQDRQISLNEEKTRQEIEISTLKAKADIGLTQAEALKSIVQAECMVLAVGDNAAINRVNARVSMLNVVGNAANTSAISGSTTIYNDTLGDIDSIGDRNNAEWVESYGQVLPALKDKAKEILSNKDGVREVFIYTPRLEIQTKERVKLYGISIYGNSHSRFRFAKAHQDSELDIVGNDYDTQAALIKLNKEKDTQISLDLSAQSKKRILDSIILPASIASNYNAQKVKYDTAKQAYQDALNDQAAQKLIVQAAQEQYDKFYAIDLARQEAIPQEVITTKTLNFIAQDEGEYIIIYESQDKEGKYKGDKVKLEARDL